jgi:hypothetical protein
VYSGIYFCYKGVSGKFIKVCESYIKVCESYIIGKSKVIGLCGGSGRIS